MAARNWYVDVATGTIVEDGVHCKLGHIRVQSRLFRALSSDISCRSSLVDKSAWSPDDLPRHTLSALFYLFVRKMILVIIAAICHNILGAGR